MHPMLKYLLAALMLLSMVSSTFAQTATQTVTLTSDAPVFMTPNENETPLRVGKQGSVLRFVSLSGDWVQIEFEDPQFGRRGGYVQTKYVRIDSPTSSRPASPQPPRPAPRAPQPAVPQPGLRNAGRGIAEQHGEVAVGYTFMRDSNGTWPVGITGSSAWLVHPGIDIVVEAQYARGTFDLPVGKIDGNIWTVLAGPRFSIGSRYGDRPHPLFQVLAGVATPKAYFGSFATKSITGLGVQPGFGVDIPLNRAVAIRPQVDWLYCRLDGEDTNAARVNVNVAFRLYRGR
jgi:hypothetical protein